MWTWIIGALVSLTMLSAFLADSKPHIRASMILAASFGLAFIAFKCPILNERPQMLLAQAVFDGTIAYFVARKSELPSAAWRGIVGAYSVMIGLHVVQLVIEIANRLLNLTLPLHEEFYLASLDVLYIWCLITVIWGAAQHGLSIRHLSFCRRPDLVRGRSPMDSTR